MLSSVQFRIFSNTSGNCLGVFFCIICVKIIFINNKNGGQKMRFNKVKHIRVFVMVLSCMLMISCMSMPVSAASKVKLSKDNFPGLYQSLKDSHADRNKDGYLSKNEIANITLLTVKKNFNPKGLELLTSLKVLNIKKYSKSYLKVEGPPGIFLDVETTAKSLTIEGQYLGQITVHGKKLTSFNGNPSTFVSTIKIECPNLQKVDVTKLRDLRYLRVVDGKLSSIDLTHNMMLNELFLFNNKLKKLDISQCVNLQMVYAYGNKLTKFDATHNPRLEYLELQHNKLTDIKLSNLKKLFDLNLAYNPLSKVDLSKVSNVVWLNLSNCKFKTVDVSKIKKLHSLNVENNQLSKIDCSKNKKIKSLTIYNNKKLKKVYVKNKKNIAKKVLVKTKITKIKRTSSTKITIYFKKNPKANGYVVWSADKKKGIAGPVKKNATSATMWALSPKLKYHVQLTTQFKVNGVNIHGVRYVSKKKY